MHGWSKHTPKHVKFSDELRSIASQYIDLEGYTSWGTTSATMFNEFIKLTKIHMHTNHIFQSFLQPTTTVEELKSYLYGIFYKKPDYPELPYDFQFLAPIDFMYMLENWSQMILIEMASKKSNLTSL